MIRATFNFGNPGYVEKKEEWTFSFLLTPSIKNRAKTAVQLDYQQN